MLMLGYWTYGLSKYLMHLHKIHKFWKNDHFNQADWDEKEGGGVTICLTSWFYLAPAKKLDLSYCWTAEIWRAYLGMPPVSFFKENKGHVTDYTLTHMQAIYPLKSKACGSTEHLITLGLDLRILSQHS